MKFSLGDRKFLRSIHVAAEPVFVDDAKFLADCGISTALTPEEFHYENTHRDFSNCRGCGVRTFEQHAADCRHGAPSPTATAAHDESIMELAKRIAKHQAPMQLDGTCRLLQEFGLPLTRENYLRLEFMGNPPAELDGELEAELPDFLSNDEES